MEGTFTNGLRIFGADIKGISGGAGVSPGMYDEEWQEVLGETREKKFDDEGEQITTIRQRLLRGKKDSEYEVSGAYGSDFATRRFRRQAELSTVGMETLKRLLSD